MTERSKSKPIYVRKKGDMPSGAHWAVIIYDTISTPGYDRDDVSQENIVLYEAFTDPDAWSARVTELTVDQPSYGARKQFTAIKVNPAEVKVSVSVKETS